MHLRSAAAPLALALLAVLFTLGTLAFAQAPAEVRSPSRVPSTANVRTPSRSGELRRGGAERVVVSDGDVGAVLGPRLAALAASGSQELVLVSLLTTPDPDLDSVVEHWRMTAVPVGGRRSVAAIVRADRLYKLATHPDVQLIASEGIVLDDQDQEPAAQPDAAVAAVARDAGDADAANPLIPRVCRYASATPSMLTLIWPNTRHRFTLF